MNDFIEIYYNKNIDEFSSEFNFDEESYDQWIAQFESFVSILKLMKHNKNMTFQQASSEIFGIKFKRFTHTEVKQYGK